MKQFASRTGETGSRAEFAHRSSDARLAGCFWKAIEYLPAVKNGGDCVHRYRLGVEIERR